MATKQVLTAEINVPTYKIFFLPTLASNKPAKKLDAAKQKLRITGSIFAIEGNARIAI